MNEPSPILCGKCHVPIKIETKDGSETWGSCPTCGQRDKFDDILREVAGYKFDKSIPAVLPSRVRKGASGVTIKGPPQRQYRWVIGE